MNTRQSLIIDKVMECYRLMDGETAERRARTSLRCPDGCGACCASENVEASVLEMMPIARSLWERGVAEAVLEAVARMETSICIFYHPSGGTYGGCCAEYPWRPTLCRMFGYAARVGKRGERDLATCAVQRRDFPAEVALARTREAEAGEAMTFVAAGELVREIDPASSAPLLPINQALAIAIGRYMMLQGLDASQGGYEDTEIDLA